MARPLRIEYPGACYHVMNRGNQRSRVFHSARHHRLFLERLERFALQFDVAVHGYCRHAHSLTHLARLFSATVGGLCTTRARVETALAEPRNRTLRTRMDEVLAAIGTCDALAEDGAVNG